MKLWHCLCVFVLQLCLNYMYIFYKVMNTLHIAGVTPRPPHTTAPRPPRLSHKPLFCMKFWLLKRRPFMPLSVTYCPCLICNWYSLSPGNTSYSIDHKQLAARLRVTPKGAVSAREILMLYLRGTITSARCVRVSGASARNEYTAWPLLI